MNDNQKIALVIVAVVIGGMLLVPPFENVRGFSMGFHPIYDAPFGSSINVIQLLAQWIGVGIVGGIAWLLLK